MSVGGEDGGMARVDVGVSGWGKRGGGLHSFHA